MNKEDYVWAFAKGLGIYLMAMGAIELIGILKSFVMEGRGPLHVYFSIVGGGAMVAVGYYLVFRGKLLFDPIARPDDQPE